ncbi:hypothetical protein WMY93_002840 [Mugilogobius chulae]|uniref:PSI domain-containing protein n=1 Tax=Mugilogobius chulae TaxID=88201 RepID=A0AAW0PXT2_9GOBI
MAVPHRRRPSFMIKESSLPDAQTSTPSPSPSTPCSSKSNTTCDECLQNVTCLWCEQTGQCIDYPVRNILPPKSVCPLNKARWGSVGSTSRC